MKNILKYLYGKFKLGGSSISFFTNWDIRSSYGKNIVIKAHSHISESSIGSNSVIENNCSVYKCSLSGRVKLHSGVKLIDVSIASNTYVASGTQIYHAEIGKFTSVGPEVIIGYGKHPTNFLSTSPIFYSAKKIQLGFSYTEEQKYREHFPVKIGNDVWIGARSIILDGITIGDGAIIAAGAIVNKDVEPFTIVGGTPAKYLRHRFSDEVIKKIYECPWWNWDEEDIIRNLLIFQKEIEGVDQLNVQSA